MALDHVRDFFHVGAMSFQPDDLTRTDPALFLTRWVTHLCAPSFMLCAGLAAGLWQARGRTAGQLSRFLWTRGLWLVLLDLVVVRFAMFANLVSPPVLLTVLWALGWSMVALAALIHVPRPVLLAASLATIALHNLADPLSADRFGSFSWLWQLLHQPGVFVVRGVVVVVSYPLIPWLAVMATGYCLGPLFAQPAAARRRTLLVLGLAVTAAFVVLRAINVYGDPQPWSTAVPGTALLSFLRTTKYPPSLLFLLMTLGPALLLLAWLDGRRLHDDHPLLVIGRVPLFYFIGHFLLCRLLTYPLAALVYGDASFLSTPLPSMGGPAAAYPPGFGYPLWAVYLLWLLVVLLMYPACRWFAGVKARRGRWWLSYL